MPPPLAPLLVSPSISSATAAFATPGFPVWCWCRCWGCPGAASAACCVGRHGVVDPPCAKGALWCKTTANSVIDRTTTTACLTQLTVVLSSFLCGNIFSRQPTPCPLLYFPQSPSTFTAPDTERRGCVRLDLHYHRSPPHVQGEVASGRVTTAGNVCAPMVVLFHIGRSVGEV